MIYLSAEVVSGLGEDTFWTWFKREFPTSVFGLPDAKNAEDGDIVLRYSTLGPAHCIGKSQSVALLWELHPEMRRSLQSNEWDGVISRINSCGKLSDYRTLASPYMLQFYEHLGHIDVLPIGVDTDLFTPIYVEKRVLRWKYQIPDGSAVGIWVGTGHPMKGFDKLVDYARTKPNVHWIIVWKNGQEKDFPFPATHFTKVPQKVLADLMNAANFFVCCGRLKPFYMVEWEAMACNLPFVMLTEREFVPTRNPREDVIRLGWDRKSAKKQWSSYLGLET